MLIMGFASAAQTHVLEQNIGDLFYEINPKGGFSDIRHGSSFSIKIQCFELYHDLVRHNEVVNFFHTCAPLNDEYVTPGSKIESECFKTILPFMDLLA